MFQNICACILIKSIHYDVAEPIRTAKYLLVADSHMHVKSGFK